MEEFAAGVASTIYKARLKGDTSRVIAIKSAASKKKFSPEPHDIVKEIGLLKYLRRSPHENVCLELLSIRLDLKFFEDNWIRWIKVHKHIHRTMDFMASLWA